MEGVKLRQVNKFHLLIIPDEKIVNIPKIHEIVVDIILKLKKHVFHVILGSTPTYCTKKYHIMEKTMVFVCLCLSMAQLVNKSMCLIRLMVYNCKQFLSGQKEYQKWMKTRPRLKALDRYAIGCANRKGSPNRICRTICQMLWKTKKDILIKQCLRPPSHPNCSCSPTNLIR